MTNPTPQPHADDVKLAEELIQSEYVIAFDEDKQDIITAITKITQPLRLSNEALRERVKELEKLIDMILSSEGKGLLLALKEHQLKLAAASEVIEKCERAITDSSHLGFCFPDGRSARVVCKCGKDEALAAIATWKQQNPTP